MEQAKPCPKDTGRGKNGGGRTLTIVPYLRHLPPNETVEHVLERFQAEAVRYPERHKQLLAVRWYLHYSIVNCERRWDDAHKGITNYKTLLDQIESTRKPKQRVCLVTFNYDTMLDPAMPTVGLTIRGLKDYIAGAEYMLVKVHGSVNWAHEVESPDFGHLDQDPDRFIQVMIEQAPELKLGQNFHYTAQLPIFSSKDSKVVIPALAIPVETKTDSSFECPTDHLETLRAFLPEVKKILIIGWRGTEAHFLKLLKDNLTRAVAVPTMVIAGNKEQAESIAQTINREAIPIKSEKAEGGFTDFILRKQGEEFLKD